MIADVDLHEGRPHPWGRRRRVVEMGRAWWVSRCLSCGCLRYQAVLARDLIDA